MPESFGNAWESERRKVAEIQSMGASAVHGKAAEIPFPGLVVSRVKRLFPRQRKPNKVILLDVSGYNVKTRLLLNAAQTARLAKALLRALQQQRSARPTAGA
jgi:hypothetical protein